MTKLRSNILLFFTLVIVVPMLGCFVILNDFFKVAKNQTVVEEIYDVQRFVEKNTDWSDETLDRAQSIRSKISNDELQSRFSNWIQARSAKAPHLLEIRQNELSTYIQRTSSSLKTENQFLSDRAGLYFTVLGVAMLVLCFGGWVYLKYNLFYRLFKLNKEVRDFSLLNYKLELSAYKHHDEIDEVTISFRALVDNLFVDLNYNLGLSAISPEVSESHRKVQEQVKMYLIERRLLRDRREDELAVEDERRAGLERRHLDGDNDPKKTG